MQKLWKVVLEAKGCEPKHAVAMQLRFRRGTKVGTLKAVAKAMAEQGYTNGGGEPYSRERIRQFVFEGMCHSVACLTDRSDKEYTVKKAVAGLLQQKVPYSSSTEKDPYLKGRLQWWRLRKVGKKPNSSWYDRKKR